MNTDIHSQPTEAIGQSESFLQFQEALSLAARADRPTLIIGERGTGKELAASRLHYLSGRWQGPFIPVNCAALAPTLLDSELFGHEAGSFTGATVRRKGRFETADSGTLFLDEIAALSREAQEKILRAVEYGIFERVGGAAPVSVNVRVIGATNADLPALAETGRFKRDLLDRLSFEVLTLPPLRERHGDIELLAQRFAARMAVEMGFGEPPAFSEKAWAALLSHPWPGNVRELKNTVERAVYRSNGEAVDDIVLDPFKSPYRPARPRQQAPAQKQPPAPQGCEDHTPDLSVPVKDAVRRLEEQYVRSALDAARHNQRQAARIMGLTYNQFRGLYRKYSKGLNDGEAH
jgi:psp operon transcriptional activator